MCGWRGGRGDGTHDQQDEVSQAVRVKASSHPARALTAASSSPSTQRERAGSLRARAGSQHTGNLRGPLLCRGYLEKEKRGS